MILLYIVPPIMDVHVLKTGLLNHQHITLHCPVYYDSPRVVDWSIEP